ncbi:Holliday junction branch migration protein RuvA [Actinocatenispora rupis]|uniref:Holliday junction branch migration complex subunit RuvA n=1 Tax=Actinocatenispora rupis TaxID=519421 RepID=A0A8J3IVU0_9ACTN|nr:Holliday junction branch migration protein RuvA [Actinocatenispora rupis]GID09638.1 Holliday junction ATP-dependent DNA helicase RuvA [Actinocatenispora rupis]
MISTVRGQVTALGPNQAIVDIGGGSGGLGFAVQCAPGTLAKLRVGTDATLHTSLVVREDSLTLYGFSDAEERGLFELLQTASGVGPKLAQAIIGVLDPTTVRRALATKDIPTLTRVPGVGKKVAERMVLELKERIGPVPVADRADEPAAGAPAAAWQEQVAQGLVGLGWSAKDASTAVSAVAGTLPDGEPTPAVPVLLKQAIRHLGRPR